MGDPASGIHALVKSLPLQCEQDLAHVTGCHSLDQVTWKSRFHPAALSPAFSICVFGEASSQVGVALIVRIKVSPPGRGRR